MLTQSWLLGLIGFAIEGGFTLQQHGHWLPQTASSRLDFILHAALLPAVLRILEFAGTHSRMIPLLLRDRLRFRLYRTIRGTFGPPYSRAQLRERTLANYLSVVSNWTTISSVQLPSLNWICQNDQSLESITSLMQSFI